MFLMTETIQQLKEDIAILQEKLQKLEELEITKTPCEIAYKDWWGEYPGDENWTSDATRWQGFQAGYNAAYEEKVSEEPEEQKWDAVRESVRWCEENPDKDPLDCLKPQTPEQVADGLKEAFREAVKQGVVSSVEKPQTLHDVCREWCDDDENPPVSDLIAAIEQWLPKEQSANSQNAYVESAVEGFNDAIKQIKSKLR